MVYSPKYTSPNCRYVVQQISSPLTCFLVGAIYQEVQNFATVADMERFLLEHGEQIVDLLGSEVDRIEAGIKVGVFSLE